MKGKQFGIAVVAVASIAATIGAGIGSTSSTPAWLEALNARSEALNREHDLGAYGERRVLGQPGPGWLEALQARSDAMNRQYGLGEYARATARVKDLPDWLVALNARSEALNRRYGLDRVSAGK